MRRDSAHDYQQLRADNSRVSAHPIPVLGSPKLMSAAWIHGGTPTPTCRTSDANEASVLFSPGLSALYGNKEPTAVSWAVKKEAVVAGEAEPIDGRVRILGVMVVEARRAILAVEVFLECRGVVKNRV